MSILALTFSTVLTSSGSERSRKRGECWLSFAQGGSSESSGPWAGGTLPPGRARTGGGAWRPCVKRTLPVADVCSITIKP